MSSAREIDIAKLEAIANRLRGVSLHLSAIARKRFVVELVEPIRAIDESVAELNAQTEEHAG